MTAAYGDPSSNQSLDRIGPIGIERAFRALQLAGLNATEAGNLVARLCGLRLAGSGWTAHEIDGLLSSGVSSRPAGSAADALPQALTGRPRPANPGLQ
jgi:hypothetical protein